VSIKVSTFDQFVENLRNQNAIKEESYNIPTGVSDPGEEPARGEKLEDPELNIDPANHELKIIDVDGVSSTDSSEMAVLKDKRTGDLYFLQFDSSDDKYDPYKNRIFMGVETDEDGNDFESYSYEDLSPLAVEAIADDVPSEERGEGIKDFSRKDLIKLDAESAMVLSKELEAILSSATSKLDTKPYEVMKKIVDETRFS
jgi:hypothetical protein